MLYLRQWRIYKNLTLKGLQERTGIDFRNLSKYELGVIDPQTGPLTTIASALDMDIAQLFSPVPEEDETDPAALTPVATAEEGTP